MAEGGGIARPSRERPAGAADGRPGLRHGQVTVLVVLGCVATFLVPVAALGMFRVDLEVITPWTGFVDPIPPPPEVEPYADLSRYGVLAAMVCCVLSVLGAAWPGTFRVRLTRQLAGMVTEILVPAAFAAVMLLGTPRIPGVS